MAERTATTNKTITTSTIVKPLSLLNVQILNPALGLIDPSSVTGFQNHHGFLFTRGGLKRNYGLPLFFVYHIFLFMNRLEVIRNERDEYLTAVYVQPESDRIECSLRIKKTHAR